MPIYLKGTVLAVLAMLIGLTPLTAQAANRLIVKDTNAATKVVLTDYGQIGLGTGTPAGALHISGSGYTTTQVIGSWLGTSQNGGGGFIGFHNNGNNALPLAGDRLGYFLFGTQISPTKPTPVGDRVIGGGMTVRADQSWSVSDDGSGGSAPAYLTFETTPVNSIYRQERFRITSTGSVGIGTTTPGSYRLYVAGDAHATGVWQTSDIRLKKNVRGIESAMERIRSLDGVEYEFRRDEFPERNLPEGKHYGVIAQQVETIVPDAVKTDEDGMKSIAYAEIIPLLIEAIKSQQREIDLLKLRVR